MIKPTKVNLLNITKHTYSDCVNCGFKVNIYWENRLINTDSEYDMENMLFEPCPKCGKPLGSKEDFIRILKQKVEAADQFCDYLLKVQSMNIGLLKEYQEVFKSFEQDEKIDDLKEINKIFFRPSMEGAQTDYTTITLVNFAGRRISLGDQIMQIQDLITNIEKAEVA